MLSWRRSSWRSMAILNFKPWRYSIIQKPSPVCKIPIPDCIIRVQAMYTHFLIVSLVYATFVNSYLHSTSAFVPEAFALFVPICVASGASLSKHCISSRIFASLREINKMHPAGSVNVIVIVQPRLSSSRMASTSDSACVNASKFVSKLALIK